jgi:hypothetical protein
MLAIVVAPYLKINLPPDSSILKLVVANLFTVPLVFPVPPLATGNVPLTPAVNDKAVKESVPLPFVTNGTPLDPSVDGNVKVVVDAVLGPAKLTAPPKAA